jgi:hypothetical protein
MSLRAIQFLQLLRGIDDIYIYIYIYFASTREFLNNNVSSFLFS